MDDAIRTELPAPDPPAAERYLLLADISGYTGFMAGVEQAHGVDFSAGIPAAYSVLGALLDTVIVGLGPAFALVKLEGDAVFAFATDLDVVREVAGDAALLVPPRDVEALSAALALVTTDAEVRSRLVRDGRARAAMFTWAATADATIAAYERAAST